MRKRKHRNYRSYRGVSYREGGGGGRRRNGQSKRFYALNASLHVPSYTLLLYLELLRYLRNSLDRFYLLLRFSMIITNKRSESVFFEHRRSLWSLHLVTISGRLLCVSTLEMRWMLRMEGGRERRAGWSHVGARLEVKVERLLQHLVSSLDSTPRVIRWF